MLAELNVIPLGTGTSLSEELAEVLKIIDTSGLSYQLTPSGTCMEGEWDDIALLQGNAFARHHCPALARSPQAAVATSLSARVDEANASSETAVSSTSSE